jgi:hypothetical protein
MRAHDRGAVAIIKHGRASRPRTSAFLRPALQRVQIGLQKCEDAVLQVVGYIPKGGPDEPGSPADGNTLDEIAQDIESEKNDESAAPR